MPAPSPISLRNLAALLQALRGPGQQMPQVATPAGPRTLPPTMPAADAAWLMNRTKGTIGPGSDAQIMRQLNQRIQTGDTGPITSTPGRDF